MVVGQARNDGREARRTEGEEPGRPEQSQAQPASRLPFADRTAERGGDGDRDDGDHDDQGGNRRVGQQAGQRPRGHADRDDQEARQGTRGGRIAAGPQVVERGRNLGEVVRQLVDGERQERQDDDHEPAQPEPPDRPALGTAGTPRIGDEERPDDRQHRDAQHVALHGDRRAEPGQQPPAWPAGRPGAPGTREGDRARQGDQVRVPDEGRLVDRGRRHCHQRAPPRARQRGRRCRGPATTSRARRRSRPARSGRSRPAANRHRSGTRPGRGGSSRPRRDGRRRSRSVGRGGARCRRGPARAG